VLPFDRILGSIRLNEVISTLNAKLLYGKEAVSNDTEACPRPPSNPIRRPG
jgi:hypothetical protein